MHDGDIDYSKYTPLEIEEALSFIDRHQFPQNYANLCSARTALAATAPAPASPEQARNPERPNDPREPEEAWPGPKYDDKGRYVPNQIPTGERASHIALSLVLFAYGSYGVWVNDLYIPGKHSKGIHLHDVPAWIMYAAMVVACFVMLTVVADHHDRRDNEINYRNFAKYGGYVGWGLFSLSIIMAVIR